MPAFPLKVAALWRPTLRRCSLIDNVFPEGLLQRFHRAEQSRSCLRKAVGFRPSILRFATKVTNSVGVTPTCLKEEGQTAIPKIPNFFSPNNHLSRIMAATLPPNQL